MVGQCVRPREVERPGITSDAGDSESGSGGAAPGAGNVGDAGAASGGATAGSTGLGGSAGTGASAGTAGSGAAPLTDGGAPVGATGGAAVDAGSDASEDGTVMSIEAAAPEADAGPAAACSPDFLVGWGDAEYQLSRDVVLDSDGNTIVAGYFDYTLTGLGDAPTDRDPRSTI